MKPLFSIRSKITISLAGTTFFVILAMSISNFVIEKRFMEAAEKDQRSILESKFDEAISAQALQAISLANLVSKIPEAQRALYTKDRAALARLFLPAMQSMRENYGVRQFQFHLAPAVSFFRVHKPAEFGDDLSGFRKTVVAVNKDRKNVSGLEVGVAGLGIRGVVPVNYKGRHVGSVEFGLSFGQPFFERFTATSKAKVALFVKRNGAFKVFASTFPEGTVTGKEPWFPSALSSKVMLKDLSFEGVPYSGMATSINDFSGVPLGVVVIATDRSEFASLSRQTNYVTGAVIFVTLLIMAVVVAMVSRIVSAPIQERTTQLAIEVEERRRTEVALIEAREQADVANVAKSRFLSQMSHELRTPLNAILGFGQLLVMNPKEHVTDVQKEYISHILMSGALLLDLIDDVLDLSRIEAGRTDLEIEDVAIEPLLKECVTLVMAIAKEKSITVELDLAGDLKASVRADYVRLKEVVLNLLTNAVKYNRVNGNVTLAAANLDGESTRITVIDTGLGFSLEDCDRIFQPFTRLNATKDKEQGTGIGLAITKKLVLLMKGKIGAKSDVGLGSEFWVDIPGN